MQRGYAEGKGSGLPSAGSTRLTSGAALRDPGALWRGKEGVQGVALSQLRSVAGAACAI